ncbi:MAG: hydrolase [Betaproteobacteria bacterium]|nr:hydrolase [Betaproteobacteria bacterium]
MISRRLFLAAVLGAALLAGCAAPGERQGDDLPAIVFVHGNGDTAALWHTTIWRFESNGYDRRLLHAIDFANPLARADDAAAQENRSSAAQQREELAAKVAEVKRVTGRAKVALVGNSRGGNAIRNYLKNGGGAAHVSHAVLSGTPNHGVRAADDGLGNEFNGRGPFLTQLNAGANEVVEGVKFLTLRSDTNDKYAQPDGRFLGQPGKPTNVSYEGPALKGAENVVLPGLDHREVAFHPRAFAEMYRFIAGRAPRQLDMAPEATIILNGKLSGYANRGPTNLPLAGAQLEVFEVSASSGERIARVHAKTIGSDGLWGPLNARPEAYYEFVITAQGYPVTHIYRSPFARSSEFVHLRPAASAPAGQSSTVSITRPRGYLGHGRDTFTIDGKVPPGVNEGVPGVSFATLKLDDPPSRAVVAVFNKERITVRNWPAAHAVIAEFHD